MKKPLLKDHLLNNVFFDLSPAQDRLHGEGHSVDKHPVRPGFGAVQGVDPGPATTRRHQALYRKLDISAADKQKSSRQCAPRLSASND
jgi:hypothetical protein